MSEKHTQFYVALSQPTDLRRSILETSKSALIAVRDFDKVRVIRHKKLELLGQLHKEFAVVRAGISRLQKALPKVPETALKKAKPKKETVSSVSQEVGSKAVEKQSKQQVQKAQKPATELERLEAELALIETKLSSLN
jgi:hypothetical protein